FFHGGNVETTSTTSAAIVQPMTTIYGSLPAITYRYGKPPTIPDRYRKIKHHWPRSLKLCRHEPSDGLLVKRPQRVGGCLLVVARRQHPLLMAPRHQHQRAVDRHDLIHEHGDVHRPRFSHAVVTRPGAVILVPLPDIALERRFGV